MAALQPTGLSLLLPLHPIDPSSGGRVRGCVSFVAEAGDGVPRLAQDGADAGGRDNDERDWRGTIDIIICDFLHSTLPDLPHPFKITNFTTIYVKVRGVFVRIRLK